MNERTLTDADREDLSALLRLAAAAIREGNVAPSPLDVAIAKMRGAGRRENPTLRRWAVEAAAWANDGHAVGCAGTPEDVAVTMDVAADAVESGRWTPTKEKR